MADGTQTGEARALQLSRMELVVRSPIPYADDACWWARSSDKNKRDVHVLQRA